MMQGICPWVCAPAWTTQCGKGIGLAVCAATEVLVTSDSSANTLSVWSIPRGAPSAGANGLTRVRTLGGHDSPAPMQFKFYLSGLLAFTPHTHLLLVTDRGHGAVHVVDAVRGSHVGYVAPPGSVTGPCGVAASDVLVAVSSFKPPCLGTHGRVHVYRDVGNSCWEPVRVIGESKDQMRAPYGLRFSADGSRICVADPGNERLALFRTQDGAFEGFFAPRIFAFDVEVAGDGGWLATSCCIHSVDWVSPGKHRWSLLRKRNGGGNGRRGTGDGEFSSPYALALVPGLGLVVREFRNTRFQVFATADDMAMRAMSETRVAWMSGTYRAGVMQNTLRPKCLKRVCRG